MTQDILGHLFLVRLEAYPPEELVELTHVGAPEQGLRDGPADVAEPSVHDDR